MVFYERASGSRSSSLFQASGVHKDPAKWSTISRKDAIVPGVAPIRTLLDRQQASSKQRNVDIGA